MAIIPQISMFDFMKLEDLHQLKELQIVLENLPDEKLMHKLEEKRGKGRDDYTVRGMWNSVIAGVIYRHESIESLRSELGRNGQLRVVCGFMNYKIIKDDKGRKIGREPQIPNSWNYSRFLSSLMEEQELIDEMFETAVSEIAELLPDFGGKLAIDGKAIQSYANKVNKNDKKDGRRELDADKGIKKYKGTNEDGSKWEKIKTWFGYELHLIVDAEYELPVAFNLTKASAAEIPEGKKLIEGVGEKHPKVMDRCEYFLADRGYDDTEIIEVLWDEYRIKPVIDMRNMWGKKDEVKMFENRNNIIGYDNFGCIYCYEPVMGERHLMGFGGYEKDRETLKYICPCKSSGIKCKGCSKCPYANKAIRIKLSEDRRRFTPVARSSYKWEKIYKYRTSVERVNSRIDNIYGFEKHFIRGIKKMKMRCSLALIVMLVKEIAILREGIKRRQEQVA